MKRLLATALGMAITSSTCLGQHTAGNIRLFLDISSAVCMGKVRWGISYPIKEKWTIDTDVCIDTRMISRYMTDKETEHWQELDEDPYGAFDENESGGPFQEISLSAGFWPQRAFKGFCLHMGIKTGDRNDTDVTIGISYAFEIRKNLGIEISSRLGIIETYRTDVIAAESLWVGVYYKF